ncbi:MAG: hypothetical protein COB73_06915 [Flavobacteriaceae bacterium]|nr:MAG: hypothetical protein COB73_06915 [Flavobacteriaceae bacterium]
MKIKKITPLFLVAIFFLNSINSFAQNMANLIPTNTATHTAIATGNWNDPAIWDTGTIPSDAAIVVIPAGLDVRYNSNSSAHIFAIRVDGDFRVVKYSASGQTALTVDFIVGLGNSFLKFLTNSNTNGIINVNITPFDIEAHKAGTSGYPQVWNAAAKAHFSDGATSYKVTRNYDTSGPRLYTYADAIAAGSPLTGNTQTTFNDGVGVIGRHQWDPDQVSIGIVTMGKIKVAGQPKLVMSMLTANAMKNTNTLQLSDDVLTQGWLVGDTLLVTRGGNRGATGNGEDEVVIQSISADGKTITLTSNLLKNHQGRLADGLHCYVGNLTRNITFKSGDKSQVTRRGHFMSMMNDSNVEITNAAFVDMGRTDKSQLLDDFIWGQWLQTDIFQSYMTALGQEIAEVVKNPANEIINSRGRYSIHLHHVGSTSTSNIATVTGNVVWGNPGWAITQHDSYANISNNVVYDVIGAGIVSEAGNELGFWDNNLVSNVSSGHTTQVYDAALLFDDYLYAGSGFAMKGRGVICRDNVISNTNEGVSIMNMNPVITVGSQNQKRMDATALATLRGSYNVDNFPLDINGYSKEGDGIIPAEVALILERTTIIGSGQGLRSIERDMGINSETRSIFDGFKAWGVNTGLRINYQTDYSFNDVFISGKNNNSLGVMLWKHSHNQTFNRIKMVDLGYAIEVSKLVGKNNGPFKTRNNGFTPWIFVDLETINVTQMYKIGKESASATANYTEHGDNTIHLSSADITSRPTTFTVLDPTLLEVDYATAALDFKIDGIITDDYGSYKMGVRQAWAQVTGSGQPLRAGYPERMYEFASTAKLDEYVANNGVYKDQNTNEIYFIITENLPNRLTNQYTPFPVRIKILNPPGSYLTAAVTESALDLAPKNRIVSRFATVTQSTTDTSLSFDGTPITAEAQKAVDGNNNGRINAQLFQQGYVPVGSLSATTTEMEPWFDMDLGEKKIIEFIDIWNSVNLNGAALETPSTHFKDFYVLVSDVPFAQTSLADSKVNANFEYLKDGNPTRKFSLNNLGIEGQYIRIQAVGNTKLEFAEVEVVGRKITAPLSVDDENKSTDTFRLYPNPTDGTVYIDFGKNERNVTIEMSNLLGQMVYQKQFNNFNNGQVELEGATGVYLLKIKTATKTRVYKIIKK